MAESTKQREDKTLNVENALLFAILNWNCLMVIQTVKQSDNFIWLSSSVCIGVGHWTVSILWTSDWRLWTSGLILSSLIEFLENMVIKMVISDRNGQKVAKLG